VLPCLTRPVLNRFHDCCKELSQLPQKFKVETKLERKTIEKLKTDAYAP
jgi:hypothetical protein